MQYNALSDVIIFFARYSTALHYACELGYENMVKLLLDAGATMSKDSDGRTPLIKVDDDVVCTNILMNINVNVPIFAH